MKKLFLFGAMGVAMALSSCSSDEVVPVTTGSQLVEVSVTASLGSMDKSRSTITEENGDLEFAWTEGDVVHAYVGNTHVGKLVAKNLTNNGKTAELTGSLTLGENDKYNIHYYYLGNGVESLAAIDLTQQSGKADSFHASAIMDDVESITVVNGVAAAQEVTLTHMLSFAHFTVVLPDGVDGSEATVTVTGMPSKAGIDWSTGELTGVENADVTVTGNDFYMTFIPGEITPAFALTVNGINYKASLSKVKIDNSRFLRAKVGEGYGGIQVSTKAERTYKLQYTRSIYYYNDEGNKYNEALHTAIIKGMPDDIDYRKGLSYDESYNFNLGTYNQEYLDAYNQSADNKGTDYYFAGFYPYAYVGLNESAACALSESDLKALKTEGKLLNAGSKVTASAKSATEGGKVIVCMVALPYENYTYNLKYVSEDTTTGMPENVAVPASSAISYTFIVGSNPTNGNKVFKGWATSKDGAVEFKAGDEITVKRTYGVDNAEITLYAVWENPTNSGSGGPAGGENPWD